MRRALAVTLILIASVFIGGNSGNCAGLSTGSHAAITVEKEILLPMDNFAISFYGAWKIDKVAGYGRVSAGEAVGRKSLGEKVAFGPDEAIICNKQIKPVYYYRMSISKEDFFRYYWVAAERLGLNGPAVEIIALSIGDRLHETDWRGQYSFVIKDDNSILINCENVWFELVRETKESE